MSPRALVTGATGFVGSHLVDALLAHGWQVRCLVRDRERTRSLAAMPVELVLGDLSQSEALGDALAEVDYVFHAAGLTRATRAAEYHEVNVTGTERLLEACQRNARSIRRFVLVSSLAAAGPTLNGAPVGEDAPCRPVSPYGRSKLDAELAVQRRAESIPWTIVRPPAVYGPRDADTLVLFRLASIGLQPRFTPAKRYSLVHARDLAHGMVMAASSAHAIGRTYFIAGQDAELDELFTLASASLGRRARSVRLPLALLDLAAIVAEGIGRAARSPTVLTRNKVLEFRQPAWLCSAARAQRELGFSPRIPLPEGIAETARWYQAANWL